MGQTLVAATTARRVRIALLAVLAGSIASGPAPPARAADEPPPVVVRAGPDGCFEIADPDVGEAWPGDGVRALVGRVGRLADPAGAAFVFTRSRDGTYERRALDVRLDDSRRVRGALLAAAIRTEAQARVAAGRASRIDRAIAVRPEDALRPPPLPLPSDVSESRPAELPPRGADLAAWAPSGFAFVRCRSVEAALRFADVADGIASRVLANSVDGADRGTLRWAIHDLVLPEVWRANPNGEKGCGECAIVLGGWDRGRPEVALLLRITDPELHRMQTAAGIGYAAMPEHRWAPADDPDPASRAPRNHRRTIGDVEVVATSERLFRRIVEPSGTPVGSDPAWKTFRGEGPVPAEAFVLFQDGVARSLRSDEARDEGRPATLWDRERLGARALLARWADVADLVPAGAAWPEGPRTALPAGALVSVRCVTDAKGADVEATFTDEESAEAARVALEACAKPFEGGAKVCASNRREVFPVARVERAAKDLAERCFVVLGWRPVCPNGGTYDAHPVTREPSCSVHGSDTAPLPDPPAARPLIRGLRREGAVVRARIPIDWR